MVRTPKPTWPLGWMFKRRRKGYWRDFSVPDDAEQVEQLTTWYYAPYLDQGQDEVGPECRVEHQWQANLQGSPNGDSTHSIVLDLDCPHEYRPSATPGHAHLIIPAKFTWRQYKRLLFELTRAGIITRGYLNWALKRKATFVRAPGVFKSEDAATSPGEKAMQNKVLAFRDKLLAMTHRLAG